MMDTCRGENRFPLPDAMVLDATPGDAESSTATSSKFQGLPAELQLVICGNLKEDTNTLASLARTCRDLNPYAAETLYNNITIINDDLARLIQQKSVSANGTCSNNLQTLLKTLESLTEASDSSSCAEKLALSPRKELTCKSLKLLTFPHDPDFFDSLRETGYISKLIDSLPQNFGCELSEKVNDHQGTTLLCSIIEKLIGIESLAVDLPWSRKLFDVLGKNLRQRYNHISEDSEVTDKSALAIHFSQLQTLELRSAEAVVSSLEPSFTKHGSISIEGSWSTFPSLEILKYHSTDFPPWVLSLLTRACRPTSISLNGFACDRTHHSFKDVLCIERTEFSNIMATFAWKNMDPCGSVLTHLRDILGTQKMSLRNLSLIRRRAHSGVSRGEENFTAGCLGFEALQSLEYLDVESRFLIKDPDNPRTPDQPFTLEWLGLPTSLETLSIDAITQLEVPYFKKYITRLLKALELGWLPKLKQVRCSFLDLKKTKELFAWKVLENLPGRFLTKGVWLAGWEYDVGDYDEEQPQDSTIASRVIARRRRNFSD